MNDKGKQLTGRRTLKNYFSSGCLPTQKHFHALIDSTLNIKDEGFVRTEANGLHVVSQGGGSAFSALLSFFRKGQEDADTPQWQVGLDPSHDTLHFAIPSSEPGPSSGDGLTPQPPRPVLSLHAGGRVGINTSEPTEALDVNGVIRAAGRIGTQPERAPDGDEEPEPGQPLPPVLANGEWHNITGRLPGCQAFEVLAGVGGEVGEGQYALLHGIAMNTFNPRGWFLNPFGFNFLHRKNRIRAQHAFYRSRRDKLELRWFGEQDSYCLQIRSRRDYGSRRNGEPVRILYHLTELWPYPRMRDGTSPASEPVDRKSLPAASATKTLGAGGQSGPQLVTGSTGAA